MVEIARKGLCLQLCHRHRHEPELVPLVELRFRTLESKFVEGTYMLFIPLTRILLDLAICFCVFLALHSHDSTKPAVHIRDHELDGEEELFGGYGLTAWLIITIMLLRIWH
jgi:hypothetical protein